MIMIVIILCTNKLALPTKCEYFSNTTKAELPCLKKTSLHFYLHDILTGADPSAILVGQPNISLGNETKIRFGSVFAINDPITTGPEANSTVIGNAHGLYMSPVKDASLSLVMYMDIGFTVGKLNGSSLCVFSRNPVSEGNGREIAVVGGRGMFQLAKGFAKVNTYSLDIITGDAVLDYHVTVYHY